MSDPLVHRGSSELQGERAASPGSDRVARNAWAWHLLGELIENVTREPLREHLRHSVLDPLGLDSTWIGMLPCEYEANIDRIGINYDFRSSKAFPILMENTEAQCCAVNCAYGGYTRATDLARFYASLLNQMRTGRNPALPPPDVLKQFCSPARRPMHDVILKRESIVGLGFMCGLEGLPSAPLCSREAFGHLGWAGSSFAYGDPVTGLSVAVITAALLPDEAARLSCFPLIDAIHRDCGLVN